MYKSNSGYLQKAFRPTNEIVEDALKTLKGVEYDTMIGSGTSGLLVIPLLARALDKHFASVRKPNDASHKECDIEGVIGDRWIFVDDFISSGATLDRVQKAVKYEQNQAFGRPWAFSTIYAGAYQYHWGTFLSATKTASCSCGACS